MKMILILTVPGDTHADHVASKLRLRGADSVRFDPALFPREAEISRSYSSRGALSSTLRIGEDQIDLNSLRSVWYRRPQFPIEHREVVGNLVRSFVKHECKVFIQDLWSSLDCVWLPAAPSRLTPASLKGTQLKVAGSLGFELPPTLITNSKADLLDFYNRHNGNIVSKLASTAFIEIFNDTFNRYTERVSKRDIAYASAIAYCPMIFQAYVPKRVELRITVVGKQVFAAEIHSQFSNHTSGDWRRYDNFHTPYFPHELPLHVEQSCVKLVEQLGLCYGAIDLILTPDDRYVFLEINPNGQYLWIEHTTGLPISDAICDLLIADPLLSRSEILASGFHFGDTNDATGNL
jgi:hypothetical protein